MGVRPQLALLSVMVAVCSGQVVDRMVAVVNKQVVLESQLDQATRVEFLLRGKPLQQLTTTDRAEVLDRLVDRALLEQQIINPALLDPTPEELSARVTEVREQVKSGAGEDSWKSLLGSYGLEQRDLEEQLTSEFRILRFVDLRFRGLVRVDKTAIADYYNDKLLPELRKKGASGPPLSDVSDKIEKILVEQRIDELLNNWLQTLHAQAHVEKMLPAPAGPPPSGAGL